MKKYKRLFEVMNYMIRAEIAAWGNSVWNKKLQGQGAKDFVVVVTKNKIQAYMNEADFEKIPSAGYKNFIRPDFVKNDVKRTEALLEEEYQEIRQLQITHLERLNNCDLGKLVKNYYYKVIEVYGHFQTTAPWFFYKIEEKIRRYFKLKINDYTERENIIRLLSRPVERFKFEQEEIDLLKIAVQLKRQRQKNIFKNYNFKEFTKKLSKKSYLLISAHQKKYEWLNADSNLTSYTIEECLKRLQETLNIKESEILAKIKELSNRQTLIIKENNQLIKKYRINKSYQELFAMLRTYAHLRFNIRFCWTQGMYYGQKLYWEIAKRARINFEEVRYCLVDELIDFLSKDITLDRMSLRARQKHYVIWMKNFKLKLYIGNQAKKLTQEVLKRAIIKKVHEVKGEIGSPGKITGRVKIITYDKPLIPQISSMKKGDILVAGQTRPEIIAACRKAGAIVTNEGGICSHAAVVSREFHLPCVIGTKIATDIFKDNDLVEVDANQGIVRKI